MLNPCLSCGACCAFFRASFYWREADDQSPGGVPVGMTRDLDPMRRVMKGTSGPDPWCVALTGEIGTRVKCAIYEKRSTVCRKFVPSFRDGERNEDCDRARAAHGLPPLSPGDWVEETDDGHRPAA